MHTLAPVPAISSPYRENFTELPECAAGRASAVQRTALDAELPESRSAATHQAPGRPAGEVQHLETGDVFGLAGHRALKFKIAQADTQRGVVGV